MYEYIFLCVHIYIYRTWFGRFDRHIYNVNFSIQSVFECYVHLGVRT